MNPSATTRTGVRAVARGLRRAGAGEVVERHYRQLMKQPDLIAQCDGVVLGPQGVPFDAYPDLEDLFTFIRALERPTLAVCGGFQALVLAWGGQLAPVHGGHASGRYVGLRKELGERQMHSRDTADPVWARVPSPATVIVSHFEGVTELPPCFDLLGEGIPCRVQAVRLRNAPVWGVQFHPEKGGDGASLLVSFIRFCVDGAS